MMPRTTIFSLLIVILLMTACSRSSRVIGVVLHHFPHKSVDGKLWDHKIFGGDGNADVFVELIESGNSIYTSSAFQDVGKSNMPLKWSLDIMLEPDNLYELILWDEDVMGKERIGSISFLGTEVSSRMKSSEGIQIEFLFG